MLPLQAQQPSSQVHSSPGSSGGSRADSLVPSLRSVPEIDMLLAAVSLDSVEMSASKSKRTGRRASAPGLTAEQTARSRDTPTEEAGRQASSRRASASGSTHPQVQTPRIGTPGRAACQASSARDSSPEVGGPRSQEHQIAVNGHAILQSSRQNGRSSGLLAAPDQTLSSASARAAASQPSDLGRSSSAVMAKQARSLWTSPSDAAADKSSGSRGCLPGVKAPQAQPSRATSSGKAAEQPSTRRASATGASSSEPAGCNNGSFSARITQPSNGVGAASTATKQSIMERRVSPGRDAAVPSQEIDCQLEQRQARPCVRDKADPGTGDSDFLKGQGERLNASQPGNVPLQRDPWDALQRLKDYRRPYSQDGGTPRTAMQRGLSPHQDLRAKSESKVALL